MYAFGISKNAGISLVLLHCDISWMITCWQVDVLSLKNFNFEVILIYFSEFSFIFVLVIKAFFVYCKVVKEKEYSSFLNR